MSPHTQALPGKVICRQDGTVLSPGFHEVKCLLEIAEGSRHAGVCRIAADRPGKPLSLVLLADNDSAHLEKVVADWVTHLNGLNRDYEILLVDDGSTDGTAKLTTGLTDRFRRLKLLRHASRQGEGAALRTGLATARYPLVCYTLCDPRYQPGRDRAQAAGGDRQGASGRRLSRRAVRSAACFGRISAA